MRFRSVAADENVDDGSTRLRCSDVAERLHGGGFDAGARVGFDDLDEKRHRAIELGVSYRMNYRSAYSLIRGVPKNPRHENVIVIFDPIGNRIYRSSCEISVVARQCGVQQEIFC